MIGVDLKETEFSSTAADEFVIADLRDPAACLSVTAKGVDEIYQLAADMGGAGYLFTGDSDAAVMHNSAAINLNMLEASRIRKAGKIFYSSSACVYPLSNQLDPDKPICSEDSVYPADPDSEYGWEKLFSERLYQAYSRNYHMQVRVSRFHNIFGEEGTWQGGKEKSPAAICRKVAMAEEGDEIEIWGDGKQTRSYLYVDECVDAVRRLMQSDFEGPVNIGSVEMVTINDMTDMVMEIAGKHLIKRHVPGPLGVRGRNSDNRLIQEKLGWKPSLSLYDGLERTYRWIENQVSQQPDPKRLVV